MYYIGFDIGGTGIQVGIVDEKGTILKKGGITTNVNQPATETIKQMADCALETLAAAGVALDDVQAIGVGVPGMVDQNQGIVSACVNLGWKQVAIREEMRKYIDKPVYIDNDANVAGLAEAVAGGSAGAHSSVFLTLGTGVGGGIVLEGKVWSGFHGTGGELGHLILVAGGEQCNCGNRGCLERYCSATAIIAMAREAVKDHPESLIMTMAEGDPAKINAKIVIDSARENDPVGTEVFQRYCNYLGQAIGTIVNFLDPEVIVLGGGVSKAGAFLLDEVRKESAKYVAFKNAPFARIELATLGADAGIIGAAMLGRTV